jgi:hypothetical protein
MTRLLFDNVGKENGLEEIEGYLGLDALLKLKKDCFVAMAPRNALFMIFSVIASEAKQHVIASKAKQHVIASKAKQHVIASKAKQSNAKHRPEQSRGVPRYTRDDQRLRIRLLLRQAPRHDRLSQNNV